MLATRQPVLRNFWYAAVPAAKLDDGPKPFRILGQDIVLFLDEFGEPAALEDRCCHRTAKLSKGWIKNGRIVCGYHGWEYDRTGKLVNVPQFPFEQAVPDARAKAFHAKTRYGYVWVCLGEPIDNIPDLPYEEDLAFRQIHQFDELWRCSALRMMENSFDNAHFAFVHKGTFGDIDQPKPEKYELAETYYGFVAETIVPVKNSAFGRAHHGNDRAMDQAQDAQRLVRAVLPHHGHGISFRPPARHLQFGDADRRRLDPAHPDPVPQRPRGGLLDRGAHCLGQGNHRRGPGHS